MQLELLVIHVQPMRIADEILPGQFQVNEDVPLYFAGRKVLVFVFLDCVVHIDAVRTQYQEFDFRGSVAIDADFRFRVSGFSYVITNG